MLRKLQRIISLNISFILYIAAALIPFMILAFYAAHSTENTLTHSAQELTDYRTSHVAEILDNEMESLFDVIYSTLNNTALRGNLLKFSRNENREYAASQIKSEMKVYTTLNPNISQCVFIAEDNAYVSWQNYRPENTAEIWEEEAYRSSILSKVTSVKGASAIPSDESGDTDKGSPVIYVGIPYAAGEHVAGVLLFGIKKQFFSTSFFENTVISDETMPEILDVAHFILTDEEQTILYMTDGLSPAQYLGDCERLNRLSEELFVVTETPLRSLNWRIYTYFPRSAVFESVQMESRRNYLLVALYALLMIYVSVIIVKHQNQRIRKVAEGIRGFQGNEESYEIEPLPNQHLNVIIQQFNLMADRIHTLTGNIRSEQQKRQEEMDLRRKAELQTLEMQINPHFLYNTLDTINWMAIDKNEMEISDMLGTLASLLRYSVTNIDRPVLILAEIEWIKKYLLLQEKRFGSLFTYELDLEDGVENRIIYKMLLQPIIENSIIHGFSDRTEGGLIRISIYTENQELVIRLCDNGCGLSPETISQFNEIIRKPGIYSNVNIGFSNVVSRLHAYYHDRFRLEIRSEEGTQITMVLMDEPAI